MGTGTSTTGTSTTCSTICLDSFLREYLGHMDNFLLFVRDMDIGYKLLLNMMMPMVIDHHRHMHDFFLRHGHGYLNDLFTGLLKNSLMMISSLS